MKRPAKLFISGLAGLYFLANCALVHAAETNFWTQRKISSDRSSDVESPLQLARLPSSMGIPKIDALRQMPQPAPVDFSALPAQIKKTLSNTPSPTLTQIVKSIPSSVATIRAISVPSKTVSRPKVIVHVQDVHLNAEAQDNIGKIVASLSGSASVGLVGLEGAFQALPLSSLRSYPNKKATQMVADYLLKEGRISGAVYAGLTEPAGSSVFVGVDDHGQYMSNINAYKKTRETMKADQNRLDQAKKQLVALEAKLNPKLRQFHAQVEGYRQGTFQIGDYATALTQVVPEQSSQMDVFLEAVQLEKALRLNEAEAERTALLGALLSKLSKAQTESLVQQSIAFRLGTLSPAAFYSYLRNVCETNGVQLGKFPAMNEYIQYVLLSDSIDVESVLHELSVLEEKAYAQLVKTTEEQDVVTRSSTLYLLGRLLEFSMTPPDWARFESVDVSALGIDVSSYKDFYRQAIKRNESMTSNLLNVMDQANVESAVLVTGGFHTHGIDALLKDRGFTTVTVSPKLTSVEGSQGPSYLSVFEQEKTPLDQLFSGEKLFVSPRVDQLGLAEPLQGAAGRHLQSGASTVDVPGKKGMLSVMFAAGAINSVDYQGSIWDSLSSSFFAAAQADYGWNGVFFFLAAIVSAAIISYFGAKLIDRRPGLTWPAILAGLGLAAGIWGLGKWGSAQPKPQSQPAPTPSTQHVVVPTVPLNTSDAQAQAEEQAVRKEIDQQLNKAAMAMRLLAPGQPFDIRLRHVRNFGHELEIEGTVNGQVLSMAIPRTALSQWWKVLVAPYLTLENIPHSARIIWNQYSLPSTPRPSTTVRSVIQDRIQQSLNLPGTQSNQPTADTLFKESVERVIWGILNGVPGTLRSEDAAVTTTFDQIERQMRPSAPSMRTNSVLRAVPVILAIGVLLLGFPAPAADLVSGASAAVASAVSMPIPFDAIAVMIMVSPVAVFMVMGLWMVLQDLMSALVKSRWVKAMIVSALLALPASVSAQNILTINGVETSNKSQGTFSFFQDGNWDLSDAEALRFEFPIENVGIWIRPRILPAGDKPDSPVGITVYWYQIKEENGIGVVTVPMKEFSRGWNANPLPKEKLKTTKQIAVASGSQAWGRVIERGPIDHSQSADKQARYTRVIKISDTSPKPGSQDLVIEKFGSIESAGWYRAFKEGEWDFSVYPSGTKLKFVFHEDFVGTKVIPRLLRKGGEEFGSTADSNEVYEGETSKVFKVEKEGNVGVVQVDLNDFPAASRRLVEKISIGSGHNTWHRPLGVGNKQAFPFKVEIIVPKSSAGVGQEPKGNTRADSSDQIERQMRPSAPSMRTNSVLRAVPVILALGFLLLGFSAPAADIMTGASQVVASAVSMPIPFDAIAVMIMVSPLAVFMMLAIWTVLQDLVAALVKVRWVKAMFVSALLALPPSVSAQTAPMLKFLTNNVTAETQMPLSYYAPSNYWKQINSRTNNLDSIMERLLVTYGLNLYDGGLWQITMARNGLFKLGDAHTERLNEGSSGYLSNIKASNDPFRYGDQKTELDSDSAFFFRMIADEYLQTDPHPDDPKEEFANFPTNSRLHHEDWMPIMGENAWVKLSEVQKAFLKYNGKIPADAPEIKVALKLLPAFEAMRSPLGGVYHAPHGTNGKRPNEISHENNISLYSALEQLEQVVHANRDLAPYLSRVRNLKNGVANYMRDHAYDKAQGVITQGGFIVNGRLVANKTFAVDCQTWMIAAFGVRVIDEWYGEGAAYRMWMETKRRSGYMVDGVFNGVGFTDGHDILSGEWTGGAILATLIAARDYEASHPEWARELRADALSMRQGVESLKVVLPNGAVAYLYSNKRFRIPFGWWANAIPSLASTAWIGFIDGIPSRGITEVFNPFVLGGKTGIPALKFTPSAGQPLTIDAQAPKEVKRPAAQPKSALSDIDPNSESSVSIALNDEYQGDSWMGKWGTVSERQSAALLKGPYIRVSLGSRQLDELTGFHVQLDAEEGSFGLFVKKKDGQWTATDDDNNPVDVAVAADADGFTLRVLFPSTAIKAKGINKAHVQSGQQQAGEELNNKNIRVGARIEVISAPKKNPNRAAVDFKSRSQMGIVATVLAIFFALGQFKAGAADAISVPNVGEVAAASSSPIVFMFALMLIVSILAGIHLWQKFQFQSRVRAMMSAPDDEHITLVSNAPFLKTDKAVSAFLNSGKKNVTALKGLPGVLDEFLFGGGGHPKAMRVTKEQFDVIADVLDNAGVKFSREAGIIDPMALKLEETPGAMEALKAAIVALRDQVPGDLKSRVEAFDRNKFATLEPLGAKKWAYNGKDAVYANAHIHDVLVQLADGKTLHTVRTYNNTPVLREDIPVLGVGDETRTVWSAILDHSKHVIVLGEYGLRAAMRPGTLWARTTREIKWVEEVLNENPWGNQPSNQKISVGEVVSAIAWLGLVSWALIGTATGAESMYAWGSAFLIPSSVRKLFKKARHLNPFGGINFERNPHRPALSPKGFLVPVSDSEKILDEEQVMELVLDPRNGARIVVVKNNDEMSYLALKVVISLMNLAQRQFAIGLATGGTTEYLRKAQGLTQQAADFMKDIFGDLPDPDKVKIWNTLDDYFWLKEMEGTDDYLLSGYREEQKYMLLRNFYPGITDEKLETMFISPRAEKNIDLSQRRFRGDMRLFLDDDNRTLVGYHGNGTDSHDAFNETISASIDLPAVVKTDLWKRLKIPTWLETVKVEDNLISPDRKIRIQEVTQVQNIGHFAEPFHPFFLRLMGDKQMGDIRSLINYLCGLDFDEVKAIYVNDSKFQFRDEAHYFEAFQYLLDNFHRTPAWAITQGIGGIIARTNNPDSTNLMVVSGKHKREALRRAVDQAPSMNSTAGATIQLTPRTLVIATQEAAEKINHSKVFYFESAKPRSIARFTHSKIEEMWAATAEGKRITALLDKRHGRTPSSTMSTGSQVVKAALVLVAFSLILLTGNTTFAQEGAENLAFLEDLPWNPDVVLNVLLGAALFAAVLLLGGLAFNIMMVRLINPLLRRISQKKEAKEDAEYEEFVRVERLKKSPEIKQIAAEIVTALTQQQNGLVNADALARLIQVASLGVGGHTTFMALPQEVRYHVINEVDRQLAEGRVKFELSAEQAMSMSYQVAQALGKTVSEYASDRDLLMSLPDRETDEAQFQESMQKLKSLMANPAMAERKFIVECNAQDVALITDQLDSSRIQVYERMKALSADEFLNMSRMVDRFGSSGRESILQNSVIVMPDGSFGFDQIPSQIRDSLRVVLLSELLAAAGTVRAVDVGLMMRIYEVIQMHA